jgi:penicillin-binding protein 1A
MRKPIKYLWRAFFIGMGLFILLVIGANFGLLGKMPSLEELENPSASLASEVIASDGTMMGKFYLEDRTNVEYNDISKNIVNALIAAEDERFYEHSGIDGRALARAIAKLGSDGGGSTITQQLALNLFRERARNKIRRVFQKIQEWIIAVKLERNFTKEEIIALYLTRLSTAIMCLAYATHQKHFFRKNHHWLQLMKRRC